MPTTRKCPRCGETKPHTVDHWHASAMQRGGRQPCRACNNAYAREYYRRRRQKPGQPARPIRRNDNVCPDCKVAQRPPGQNYCNPCRKARGHEWYVRRRDAKRAATQSKPVPQVEPKPAPLPIPVIEMGAPARLPTLPEFLTLPPPRRPRSLHVVCATVGEATTAELATLERSAYIVRQFPRNAYLALLVITHELVRKGRA